MYFEEFIRRVQRTGTLWVALGLVTALQGFSMFFGLRDLLPAGSTEAVLVPPAGAVVVVIAFWFVWHWLLLFVPLAHDPAKRAMGLMVGAVLTAVGIGTTSWFIASSIGGSRAVQAHVNVEDRCERTPIVTDRELADPAFIRALRDLFYSLNVSSYHWLDFLTDLYQDYHGCIVDESGRTVLLDMEVFEVPHIRDWFRDFCCTPCPPQITPTCGVRLRNVCGN